MNVYGIDFTSTPSRRKPITCRHCRLEGDVLRVLSASAWPAFEQFEAALARPGPWIAGIDFPFGMPRRFVAGTGWPVEWPDYVRHAEALGKEGFEAALNAYRKRQRVGQKEHRRRTDVLAGSLSPQKLYGTPVGKMFFQGAPRLQQAGVAVPGLQQGDRLRVVVEAYPGVLARSVTKAGYKHDRAKKQTIAQRDARHGILRALTSGRLAARYGVTVAGDDPELVDDPTGDTLDALLCAVQAAWAWRNRARLFGNPRIDRFEGWIADPCGVPGSEPGP
ncbi:MAG: DUF429 domain-containing protein [Gammaproteobacteria bacterium]|nr:DUF429 domain-containing protein [Gammaproteobacteria bacterium]